MPRKYLGISSLVARADSLFRASISQSSQSANISSGACVRSEPMGLLSTPRTDGDFVQRSRYLITSLVFILIESEPFFSLSNSSSTRISLRQENRSTGKGDCDVYPSISCPPFDKLQGRNEHSGITSVRTAHLWHT